MNGAELAKLHEDVKELTVEVKENNTKIDLYFKQMEDHEIRIRKLEAGERKSIIIITASIASVITTVGTIVGYLIVNS
jgi:hypothetical protein